MKNMTINLHNIIQEPMADEKLWEAGYFTHDFNTVTGTLSRPLEFLGFTKKEMNTGMFQSRIHPDDLPEYLHMLNRMLDGLDDELHYDYRLLDKRDNWNWMHTDAVVISRNQNKSIHRLFGMDRLINNEKRQDEYLRQELKEAKKELKELRESLED